MNQSSNSPHLVADLGGTHVRFAHAVGEGLAHCEKLVCADFDSLAAAMHHYLALHPLSANASCCIAIAAPLDGDLVQLTNSSWSFSLRQLQEEFNFQQLLGFNDFEAIAHAVPYLQTGQLEQIGGGQRQAHGNMAVLGPGTGLGVKHLTYSHGEWKVLMGEGGQVDFAPVDDMDLRLWHHMKDENAHVAAEDILSGRGLVHIYHAHCESNGKEKQFSDAATIIEAGLTRRCVLCTESLSQFLSILGSFAGNLALNLQTTGGVYLCGGVLTALADRLDSSEFRSRFEAKGRFQKYVAGIPTYLITEPEPGLMGAARYLQTKQNQPV